MTNRHSTDTDSQLTRLAALGEPIRRLLYRFVAGQKGPVSRDQAAEGVGIARHVAKFHLDKLAEDGLLDTDYRRPAGRGGPGAGRPTKLYRAAQAEIAVSLPERHYDLAADILAQAVTAAQETGAPIRDALQAVARQAGARLAQPAAVPRPPSESDPDDVPAADADRVPDHDPDTARDRDPARDRGPEPDPDPDAESGPAPGPASDPASDPDPTATICGLLAANGYEPDTDIASIGEHSARITLRNCPFHRLAEAHTDLVCNLNLDLLTGLVDSHPGSGLTAHLDPSPGRCCVVLTPTAAPTTVSTASTSRSRSTSRRR
ncbi:MAG: transcriptional regulator [Actinocrinis sp.]